MCPFKSITIAGGGLAGLTLGIGLRQRGVPVSIWEAGQYPRHRVCGEFISGNGLDVLERFGLQALLRNAGAFRARTAMFFSGPNRSPSRRLATPALCLSRFAMDAALAEEFQRLGGELRQHVSCNSVSEGVVYACGRRPQPTENGWRWFGLKTHAQNVELAADLEMHVSSAGYVGVNRINDGEVNICGLFRARAGDPGPAGRFEALRGRPGSPLHERLGHAVFDETSFCAVAGLSLKPQRAADKKHCSIGDALTMIPPVTGNGMSMAFESAAFALEPLTAYSRGQMTWTDAQLQIATACDAAFTRRLAWARFLQWLMFSPALQSPLGSILLRSEWLWQLMFAKTR